MHADERVVEELEALQAILMEELKIKTDERGRAVSVETEVDPWTALDRERQFVKVTLEVVLSPGYPDSPPELLLRNPRGLDDSTLAQMRREVAEKCATNLGQPVIFEIIQIVKERLTDSNIPSCECCICLYGFRQGDAFTKTDCYHYFHSLCLAGHIATSERIFKEEQDKLPPWQQTETFQAVCPVCRASISYSVEDLRRAPPPLDLSEAPHRFTPTPELRSLQASMRRLYLHQQSKGGIIQASNRILATEERPERDEGPR